MFRLRLSVLHILATAGCLYPGAPASDFQMLFEKGRACEQAADWACAEASYRACLELQPAAAEALSNLGVVLAHQGKFDAAIAAYVRTLRLRPSLTPVRVNLGLAYYKTGRLAAAIREFRLYLAKDPGNRQTRQLLATALLESDQYAEAAEAYKSLLPGGDLSIRLGLAIAYARLKRVDESERLLDAFLADPNSAASRLALGQAYLAANDFERSEQAFRAALQLEPSLAGAHFGLGAVRWKQQDEEGAIEEWRAELNTDPANFEAVFALGATIAVKGDLAEARTLLERARSMRSGDAATLYHLARIDWKEHRPGALELLEKSVRLDPKNRQARYLLAQVYRAQGRDADAAREFDMVRRLSAQDLGRDEDVLRGR